jgi:hypothetical protein
VQQAVRSVFGGQPTYANLDSTAMVNTSALPSRMVSGTTIRHAFNSSVTILPADAGGGPESGFSIAFSNIPKDSCLKMASSDLGRGLYSIQVNTTTAAVQLNVPLSPTTASTNCSSASSNLITWLFN